MNKTDDKDCVVAVEILPGVVRKEQRPPSPVIARIRKLRQMFEALEAELLQGEVDDAD